MSALRQPRLRPLSTCQTKLTGGVLAQRGAVNIENLFGRIDVRGLQETYAATHDSWHAEPEFCGKYLDTAMQVFGTTGDGDVLDRAGLLVNAILAGQREDGYLGTYHPGLEFDTFSIWNHHFTMWGLLAYWEVTGDETVLEGARRGGDFLADSLLAPNAPDLLDAINQGIEHSCLLRTMTKLYRLTREERYLAVCDFVVRRWEESNLRLVSAPLRDEHPVFAIGCLKAAEMLICYQGLVELAELSGHADYLRAAEGYWRAVHAGQLNITGNGSITEYWNMLGNRITVAPQDVRPNENCVAVCWMKLSALLLEATGDAKYADAFEGTLYNHLLGAQALDGADFSYYQALEGRKIHVTVPGLYSCCRYRGMNMLAHLPRYVVMQNEVGLTVNLYASSVSETELNGVPVRIEQRTQYPREGKIEVIVSPREAVSFELRLRVPAWCPKAEATVNGAVWPGEMRPGYLRLEREWAAGDAVTLSLEMPVRVAEGTVLERPVHAVLYGPLVLALDSRFGVPVEEAVLPQPVDLRPLALTPETTFPIVQFAAGPLTLVDYASAGSAHPTRDRFRVWLP